MGSYLAQPLTTKKINSQESATRKLRFFSCEMQGWRRQMEDASICNIDLQDGNSLFAVFDGHGGNQVSTFAKQNFEELLLSNNFYKQQKYVQALSYAIHKLDQMIESDAGEIRLKQLNTENRKKLEAIKHGQNEKKSVNQPLTRRLTENLLSPRVKRRINFGNIQNRRDRKRDYSCESKESFQEKPSPSSSNITTEKNKISYKTGCTAHIILITPQKIYSANTGDSRSFLCRNNRSYPLSFDHKPENPDELERITTAGFRIINGRINGGLNLSRTLGDFAYKSVKSLPQSQQPIICSPDIRTVERVKNDEFILIGCDGIFQKYYFNEQPLADQIKKGWKKRKSGTQILVNLFEKLLAKDTNQILGCDNMSAILIEFI